MSDKEKLTEILKFRCTESEKELIKFKAEQSNYFRVSDYLRKQAVNGKVLKLNDDWYVNVMRQVSGMANNLNQIARHVNDTKTVYQSDMSDLKMILFNLGLHIEMIESAVEKLYGNNKNQVDTRNTVQSVGVHNEP